MARALVGAKVAVVPTKVTEPATGVVPCFRVKLVVLIVEGSIVSLKVAAIFLLIATPVAAFAGSVELTVGRVVSAGIPNPTVLASNVTAPFRAKALPSTAAPVVTVMEAKAR